LNSAAAAAETWDLKSCMPKIIEIITYHEVACVQPGFSMFKLILSTLKLYCFYTGITENVLSG
jgi:ABC-type transport system involved in Fe-S cluster assembly fused permease/ATPase subunit